VPEAQQIACTPRQQGTIGPNDAQQGEPDRRPGMFQRAQYNSGWSYLGDVKLVAVEVLSQDGRL